MTGEGCLELFQNENQIFAFVSSSSSSLPSIWIKKNETKCWRFADAYIDKITVLNGPHSNVDRMFHLIFNCSIPVNDTQHHITIG